MIQTFTRQQWAQSFAPGASQRVLDWIIGWTIHEYGGSEMLSGRCSYNLLNTHSNAGAPRKCAGDAGLVSAYDSLAAGATANRNVLKNAGYSEYHDLDAAISSNNIAWLTSGKADAAMRRWVGTPANYGTLGLSRSFEIQGRGLRSQSMIANLPTGTQPPASDGTLKTCDIYGLNSVQCVTCLTTHLTNPGACSSNTSNSTLKCAPCGLKPDCCEPDLCIAGVCVPGGKNATDAASNFLPGWLTAPDWGRVVKFLLGLVAIGFGLALIYAILTEKGTALITGSAAYKGGKKIVAAIS